MTRRAIAPAVCRWQFANKPATRNAAQPSHSAGYDNPVSEKTSVASNAMKERMLLTKIIFRVFRFIPVSTIAVSTLLPMAVAADAAPSQALNKTVTVSFTATGTATPLGGQPRGFSTAVTQTIYVSGAGRIFRKFSATSSAGRGRATNSGGFAPGEGKGSFTFQGNRLVGFVPFEQGARQITIDFNGDFTTCNASIIEGRASSGVIRRKAPNGEMVELSNGTTSSPSCSIQTGNAFAQ